MIFFGSARPAQINYRVIYILHKGVGPTMAHRISGDGDLEEVGWLQLKLHSLYARKAEPLVLAALDLMMRSRFFMGPGLPVLRISNRFSRDLPRAEVVSTERAKDFIDALSRTESPRIMIGPCVCQESLGRRKGIHMKDMTILYGTEIYTDKGHACKDIAPDEAKNLLDDLGDEGCVHCFFACMNSPGWLTVICSCDREICVPLRAHNLMGGVVEPGPDVIEIEGARCIGCGRCVDRCPFGANALDGSEGDQEIRTDINKCYGCGVCVQTCPAGARKLGERKGYRSRFYPLEFVEKFRAGARVR